MGGNTFFHVVLRGGGDGGYVGLEYASVVGKDGLRYFLPVLGGSIIAGCFIRVDTGARYGKLELDAFLGPAGVCGALFAA